MRLLTFVSAALGLAANALSQARPAAHYDVDRTPFVEIGGDGTGNDPLLAAVFSATKTAQGFVVGESHSATLQFLDARGKVVHTTGRRGQGPGEFMGSIFINQCACRRGGGCTRLLDCPTDTCSPPFSSGTAWSRVRRGD